MTKDSVEKVEVIEEKEEKEIIHEDLIQEIGSGDKINLNAYILEIIKDIKKVYNDFTE